MTQIERLNRRLGESLGFMASGTQPRFAWKWSADIPLLADRIGHCWILTEWRRPSMTPEQWHQQSSGRFPYPAAGMYHPYFESALPFGEVPTPELTQAYIATIDKQISTSMETQLAKLHIDRSKREAKEQAQYVDRIQNDVPAYNNFDWGKRGGHVSFGGI